jgi:competence protein ComEC
MLAPVEPRALVDRAEPRPELRATFLDVGQGDATLLQLPGARAMLVDTGGLPGTAFDIGERVVVPAALALGVRRLDVLVVTHGDPDHIGGAPSLLRALRPREIWEGVPVPPHPELARLRELATRQGGGWRRVVPGDRLAFGPVEIVALHPPPPDWERQRVRNDDSIVLDVRYGDVSILLPGDIGAGVERALAASLEPAAVRILKAAHHGSAGSTSGEWLAAARPAAVVFSSGRGNRYGHPSPVVLARVRRTGAAVFRTDEDGAIEVRTDGRAVRIEAASGRRWSHEPR